MIAKVERISRVNGISNNLGSYGQRQGYAENNGGREFEKELNSALRQKEREKREVVLESGQPYILSVTRATQSLFYQNGLPEERLGHYLHGI